MKISPDGTRIVTGSNDNTARLWDARTGNPLGKPMLHEDRITGVDFDQSGELLLTVSKDKFARLWDTSTCAPVGLPYLHAAALSACAFVPGRPAFVTGCVDGNMQFVKMGVPLPKGGLKQLLLWIEVRTGLHEDASGIIQQLSQSEWEQRAAELNPPSSP